MKKFLELVNEVAKAVSPADKEFVALHRIVKTQRVAYPEHQFKGGTEKDHTKLTTPSNETGMEDAVAKEKPVMESWKEYLEEATPDSKGLTSRHLEKALHNGGYTGCKIKSSKFVKDAGKSGHQYHVTFHDDVDGHESGHIYVKKDEKGVHKADF
jgi:hypothetical protein